MADNLLPLKIFDEDQLSKINLIITIGGDGSVLYASKIYISL